VLRFHQRITGHEIVKMRAKAPWLFAALFLTMIFCAAASAQMPAKKHLPGQLAGDVLAPNPKGTNPKPEDATTAIFGRVR
jgi:hypothetical protein